MILFCSSKCGGSHLSLLFMCLFPCECLNLYCLKAFLYTIRYYCMVCVCLSVSEPAKHVPVCFCSLLLKGSLDFGFIYLKNLFLSFFPSYNYLLCFFYSLLSARTLIKHTLSAWKTLNSLLFITQWSSRHHLYYTAFSECNCLKIECCFVVVVVYACTCE